MSILPRPVFLSRVSREFGLLTEELRSLLQSVGVHGRSQLSFRQEEDTTTTLSKLSEYIHASRAVASLIGHLSGGYPSDPSLDDSIYPAPPSGTQQTWRQLLPPGFQRLSYTQWEVILARFWKKPLYLYFRDDRNTAPFDQKPIDDLPHQKSFADYLTGILSLDREYFADTKDLKIFILRDLWPHELNHRPAPREDLEFPPLKVLIVGSRGNEPFSRRLQTILEEYRQEGQADRKCFTVSNLQDESLIRNQLIRRETTVESDIILCLLPEVDQFSGEVLQLARAKQHRDFQVTYKKLFDYNRNPRIIGVARTLEEAERGVTVKLPPSPDAAPGNTDYTFGGDDVRIFSEEPGCTFCRELYKSFYPQFTLIHDAASFQKHQMLFQDAMKIYKLLIPDDSERDDPDNIRAWICDESEHKVRANWLDYLLIAHFPSGDVFGVFWCNIDIRNGLGHVPFWGLLEDYRKAAIGVHVAGIALQEGERLLSEETDNSVAFQGVVFEAEPADLSVFQRVFEEACRQLCPPPPVLPEVDHETYVGELKKILKRLTFTEEGEQALIHSVIMRMTDDPAFAAELDEELRRFRRFAVYAQGADGTSRIMREKYGYQALGFTNNVQSKPGDHVMALYTQPPIKSPSVLNQETHEEELRPDLPVSQEDQCEFSLFLLVTEHGRLLSAKEVSDWEYDCFLGEQFHDEVPDSGLIGWNDYMAANRSAFQESFVQSAGLEDVQLGRSYRVAQFIRGVLQEWPRDSTNWNLIRSRIKPRL